MEIIDLVQATASPVYMKRNKFLTTLEDCDPQIHSLTGAALGLAGEVGEFADLIKKHIFQGKDLDPVHMKKELGDVLWYVGLAAIALDITIEELEELISMKLLERYVDGFTVEASNNRKKDDI